MSLIMMKTSQLPPLAFSLYKTYCPAGISEEFEEQYEEDVYDQNDI